MAFNFVKTVGGVGRKLELVLLANSQTVAVGDAIQTFTTGKGTLATATNLVGGIVHALCDANGYPVRQTSPVAGTASGVDLRSVATGTAAASYALVDFSEDTIYSAAVNGTLGSTATSNLRGILIDVDSANTSYGRVLETTATRTEGVEANFYSWGVDPKDSTRLLVSIAMSELRAVTT
jgi:hypothetical protein